MKCAKALLFLCTALICSCNNKSADSLNRGELKKGTFIVLHHQASIKEKYDYENDEYLREPSRYGTQARIDKIKPDQEMQLYLLTRSLNFCRVIGFIENTNENGITMQKIENYVNDAKSIYYTRDKAFVFYPWTSVLSIELGNQRKPENIEVRNALQ